MDFFANAFVTRDIPTTGDEDEEQLQRRRRLLQSAEEGDEVSESEVVVKDGIQIREKTIFDSEAVQCEVCNKNRAKYKCPGCFCQTCSLPCSKQHKLDTTCLGQRSRTQFVDRKKYTEQDMMSDYNFLEEIGRTVDNAARDNLRLGAGSHANRKRPQVNSTRGRHGRRDSRRHQGDHDTQEEEDTQGDSTKSAESLSLMAAQELERQGAEGSGTYRDKQLIMQAKKRGVHLIMMAEGLKKRKENHTQCSRDKPCRILWTIEWLFPQDSSVETANRRILQHKVDESTQLKDALASALSTTDNNDLKEQHPAEDLENYSFYFSIPLRHANKPALYPLTKTQSVQEALKFKKVLEYPTILVLKSTASTAQTNTTTASTSSLESTTEPLATKEDVVVGETLTVEEKESGQTSSEEPMITNLAPGASTVLEKSKDHSHHLLAAYSIEEAPSSWPKKTQEQPQSGRGPGDTKKRGREDDGEEDTADPNTEKKARTNSANKDDTAKGSDDDSDSDSDDSSDDDSSSDSDSDSDSDPESSADESSSAVQHAEKSEHGEDVSMHGEEAASGDVDASVSQDSMAVGQAIMEAFQKDFGEAE